MLKSSDIRRLYIEFFKSKEHRHVPSSPIVPPDDPTLLFTTAGMVQFKRLYSGAVELPYTRATTVQKCLRAGGKGSDLENVGHTLRHHTFFEMLGNFSFGDYFKREALTWAWEFVTTVLKLDTSRIYASVYEDDDEAWDIWTKEIGLPESRMVRLGAKDNFWGPAGDTGACGPCSEIYYDRGEEYGAGLTFQHATINDDDPMTRYIEFWNCVFPQFDQQKDGTRLPLKNRGVDTGMGLERLCCIVQNAKSPFETDLFSPICDHVIKLAGLNKSYKDLPIATRQQVNVVADHVRALTFALTEGILPSNEGRGYVLRRLLRRAARYGRRLGIRKPFMAPVVDTVVAVMGDHYPELKLHTAIIKRVIMTEEESFVHTLTAGLRHLEGAIDLAKSTTGMIDGSTAFTLSTTHGLPFEDLKEIAEEHGLDVNHEEFNNLFDEHKQISRKGAKGTKFEGIAESLKDVFKEHGATVFTGFPIDEEDIDLDALLAAAEQSDTEDAQSEQAAVSVPADEDKEFVALDPEEADDLWDEINAYPMIEYAGMTLLAAFKGADAVGMIQENDEVALVFDATPFYAESGGQVADTGVIDFEFGKVEVTDVQKTVEDVFVHFGKVVSGTVKVGEVAVGCIDEERRWGIMRNHTSAHLLQAALRQVVGSHVTQQGSYVSADYLRFDFTNPEGVTAEQLAQVERIVNTQIQKNLPVLSQEMALEEARNVDGVIAPFGEKYGHKVRVIQIPECSAEFCGGTHMPATGGIGAFFIVSESSIASGIRRIESVTGDGAVATVQGERALLRSVADSLNTGVSRLTERLDQLQQELKVLRKEVADAKAKETARDAVGLLDSAESVNGVSVICKTLENVDGATMRLMFDALKACRQDHLFVVLGSVVDDKVVLMAAGTPDVAKKVHAGNLIKQVAFVVNGKGGGKPDMAQAGGSDISRLPNAISLGDSLVKDMLNK